MSAEFGITLNIGCGQYPVMGDDWLNIDPDPNVRAFVESLPGSPWHFRHESGHALSMESGAADRVYACHVLEHYLPPDCGLGGQANADSAMSEWWRVLRPGGELWVAVPDILVVASRILSEQSHRDEWLRLAYGWHASRYDHHMWGYTWDGLGTLMIKHGFDVIGHWEPFVRNPVGEGFDCAGCHGLDEHEFTVPCSLNMRARKPELEVE